MPNEFEKLTKEYVKKSNEEIKVNKDFKNLMEFLGKKFNDSFFSGVNDLFSNIDMRIKLFNENIDKKIIDRFIETDRESQVKILEYESLLESIDKVVEKDLKRLDSFTGLAEGVLPIFAYTKTIRGFLDNFINEKREDKIERLKEEEKLKLEESILMNFYEKVNDEYLHFVNAIDEQYKDNNVFVSNIVSDISNTVDNLNDNVKSVNDNVNSINDNVNVFENCVDELKGSFEEFSDKKKDSEGDTVISLSDESIERLSNTVNNKTGGEDKKAEDKNVDAFKKVFSKDVVVEAIITALILFLPILILSLMNFFVGFWTKIGLFFSDIIDSIKMYFGRLFESLIPALTRNEKKLKEIEEKYEIKKEVSDFFKKEIREGAIDYAEAESRIKSFSENLDNVNKKIKILEERGDTKDVEYKDLLLKRENLEKRIKEEENKKKKLETEINEKVKKGKELIKGRHSDFDSKEFEKIYDDKIKEIKKVGVNIDFDKLQQKTAYNIEEKKENQGKVANVNNVQIYQDNSTSLFKFATTTA